MAESFFCLRLRFFTIWTYLYLILMDRLLIFSLFHLLRSLIDFILFAIFLSSNSFLSWFSFSPKIRSFYAWVFLLLLPVSSLVTFWLSSLLIYLVSYFFYLLPSATLILPTLLYSFSFNFFIVLITLAMILTSIPHYGAIFHIFIF